MLVGGFTGFLGGLFGKGGSAIATPLLHLVGVSPFAALASPLPATIPATAVAAWAYHRAGQIDLHGLRRLLVAGVQATVVGAVLTRWVGGDALILATDVVVALLGVRLLSCRHPRHPAAETHRHRARRHHARTGRARHRPIAAGRARPTSGWRRRRDHPGGAADARQRRRRRRRSRRRSGRPVDSRRGLDGDGGGHRRRADLGAAGQQRRLPPGPSRRDRPRPAPQTGARHVPRKPPPPSWPFPAPWSTPPSATSTGPSPWCSGCLLELLASIGSAQRGRPARAGVRRGAGAARGRTAADPVRATPVRTARMTRASRTAVSPSPRMTRAVMSTTWSMRRSYARAIMPRSTAASTSTSRIAEQLGGRKRRVQVPAPRRAGDHLVRLRLVQHDPRPVGPGQQGADSAHAIS